MNLRCPHCKNVFQVEAAQEGRVGCPSCGVELRLKAKAPAAPPEDIQAEERPAEPEPPARAAKRPVRAPLPNRRRVEAKTEGGEGKEGKKEWSLLKTALIGIPVIVLCAVFAVWNEDRVTDNLLQDARKRIEAARYPAEKTALLLLLARAHHGSVVDMVSPKNLRGKKVKNAILFTDYWPVLEATIESEYASLTSTPKKTLRLAPEYLWEHKDYERGTCHIVRFKSDGSFLMHNFDTPGAGPDSYSTKSTGKWEHKDGAIIWSYDGKSETNPIIANTSGAFVLKETDGLSYWRSILNMPHWQPLFGK